MGEAILSGGILGMCALIMFGIGIAQWKSKKPVGFYTGEKAPDVKALTDVKAWNRKHGMMWILYGGCIVLAWGCGLLIGDSLLLIPFCACVLQPIPLMMLYHQKLIRKYRLGGRKDDNENRPC